MPLSTVTTTVNLTPVVQALIGLITTLIGCVLIPFIRSKYGAQKLAEMERWVDIAVAAAQQLYYNFDGETRKRKALEFLKSKGYDIESPAVLNALEAAVLRLHSELAAQGSTKIILPATSSDSKPSE